MNATDRVTEEGVQPKPKPVLGKDTYKTIHQEHGNEIPNKGATVALEEKGKERTQGAMERGFTGRSVLPPKAAIGV